MVREKVTAGTRRVQPPGLPRAPRSFAFDSVTQAHFTLSDTIASQAQTMRVYVVPTNAERAIVKRLAVVAEPMGYWFERISWDLRVSDGSLDAFAASSFVVGTSPAAQDAGLRWTYHGALGEPQPVTIELGQSQTLLLAITAEPAVADLPISIYTRASGVYFVPGY